MTIRFVALGDSYTIGTSVEPHERWPDQLVERARDAGVDIDLLANPAVNGFTTDDLIRDELPLVERLSPDLVSVLIGVNDVVQGRAGTHFEANASAILDRLLGVIRPGGIVCIEIPDYTVTPAGRDYGDPVVRRREVQDTNATLARLAGERDIAFVDGIWGASQAAADDRSLVAQDGLHPSGAQYALWVDRIWPVIRRLATELA